MAKYGLDDYQLKAQADTLTHNELLQGILDEMQDNAFKSWIATSPQQIELREDAYNNYKAVENLRQTISNTLAEIAARTVTEKG